MIRFLERIALLLATILTAIVFSKYTPEDDKHWRDME